MGLARLLAIAVALASLLGAGCSDLLEATDANFARAAQAYLDANPPCVDLEARLPAFVALAGPRAAEPDALVKDQTRTWGLFESSGSGNVYGEPGPRSRSRLEVLAQVGVMQSSAFVQRVRAKGSGGCNRNGQLEWCLDGEEFALPARRYHAAAGREGEISAGPRSDQLCYGWYEVQRVAQFTVPADNLLAGMQISVVDFEYTLEDAPEWVSAAPVRESGLLRENALDAAAVRRSKAAFLLTRDGWVHEKLYERAQELRAQEEAAAGRQEPPALIEIASFRLPPEELESAIVRRMETDGTNAVLANVLEQESIDRELYMG